MVIKELITSAANTLASFKNGSATKAFTEVAAAVSEHRRRSSQEVGVDLLKDIFDVHNNVPLCKDARVQHVFKTLTRIVIDCVHTVRNLQSPMPSASPTIITRSPALLTGTTAVSDFPTPPATPTIAAVNSTAPIISIEDFDVKKFLGSGAFGAVYLVECKVSKKAYALKVIGKENLRLSQYDTIFEEQRIMKTTTGSDRTVSLKGSFQDSDNFYILTDYLSGGDLRGWLGRARAPLPTSAARRYLAELILALEDIHRRRVIHRDLKPDNILLDSEGHIRIADFGISTAFGISSKERPWEAFKAWSKDPATNSATLAAPPRTPRNSKNPDYTQTPCGTGGFIAPEVYSGRYSYECDIWSLGVIFHLMILGRFPFGMIPRLQSRRALAKSARVDKLSFTVDDEIDSDAEELLHMMLEKGPADRATIGDMKAHSFFNGVNWAELARKRMPSKNSIPCNIDFENNEETVKIPVGEPYAPGASPYPWFDFVSPELLANFGRVGSDSVRDRVAVKIGNLKLNVVQRVKKWWRRRGIVEVKPRVGAMGLGLLD